MPAATRSSRKKAKRQEEKVSDSDDNESSGNVEQEEHLLPPTASNNEASSTRKHSREVRRKRREEIKSRTTGVGLSISTRASGSNKIVFGDNHSIDENPPHAGASNDKFDDIDRSDAEHDSDFGKNSDSSDDDDDDAVEEVKSSVARDKVMEQLARERDSSKVQKLQTRTKKRKTKTLNQEEEDEFDEDFFAQVDSEIANERKQKKMDKESTTTSAGGRHTTFLSTEEEADLQPIQADHNIELVVLGNGHAETNQVIITEDKEEPSELSHLFARGRLADGKEQAKVKGTKKKKQSDTGWKRSKKMSAVAFGQAKVARRKGRGTAAANFVVLQSKVGN